VSVGYATAQDIKVKNNEVYLNNQLFLKYKKTNLMQISFYSLAGDEILFYHLDENNTAKEEDDFFVLHFLTVKRKVAISDFSRITSLGVKKLMERLISWLVQDKVLNAAGEVSLENLDIFSQKYEDTKLSGKK
jgi:hypothetical protein